MGHYDWPRVKTIQAWKAAGEGERVRLEVAQRLGEAVAAAERECRAREIEALREQGERALRVSALPWWRKAWCFAIGYDRV